MPLENFIAVTGTSCICESLWDCEPHSGYRREGLNSVLFSCSTWISWRIAVACGKKLFWSCYLILVSGSSTFSCLNYGSPFSAKFTLRICNIDFNDSILDWPLESILVSCLALPTVPVGGLTFDFFLLENVEMDFLAQQKCHLGFSERFWIAEHLPSDSGLCCTSVSILTLTADDPDFRVHVISRFPLAFGQTLCGILDHSGAKMAKCCLETFGVEFFGQAMLWSYWGSAEAKLARC